MIVQASSNMEDATVLQTAWHGPRTQALAAFFPLILGEKVCIPQLLVAAITVLVLALSILTWYLAQRLKSLSASLDQSKEDGQSLAELFSCEIERLRSQLSQSQEDSESLDQMLGSILQGGLPGHLEMVSMDYWCVRTMTVGYTDQDGQRHSRSQSGYHINFFIPGGARDLEVTFGVVGGADVKKVDRGSPDFPYVYTKEGQQQLEKFCYDRCPANVRFEIRGPSLASFVSAVSEMEPHRSRQQKEPSDKST